MKIALIGYGAMGQLVAKLAKEQGHEIALTLNSRDADRLQRRPGRRRLAGATWRSIFLCRQRCQRTLQLCMQSGVPLVEGTTGWQANRDELAPLG